MLYWNKLYVLDKWLSMGVAIVAKMQFDMYTTEHNDNTHNKTIF